MSSPYIACIKGLFQMLSQRFFADSVKGINSDRSISYWVITQENFAMKRRSWISWRSWKTSALLSANSAAWPLMILTSSIFSARSCSFSARRWRIRWSYALRSGKEMADYSTSKCLGPRLKRTFGAFSILNLENIFKKTFFFDDLFWWHERNDRCRVHASSMTIYSISMATRKWKWGLKSWGFTVSRF